MIRFPQLEALGVTAIMSDISDGDCCSRDDAEAFLSLNGISSPADLHLVRQVHGIHLIEPEACAGLVEADGLYSSTPGAVMGIRVADCVPILVYDPVKCAGAIIHAGREGTRQGIAQEAIVKMRSRFGSQSTDLTAVIGPSAGPCCYEVGPDVQHEFSQSGGKSVGNRLDLWETNRSQLLKSAIPESQVHVSGECTICSEKYHSFRKSATTSRNLAILMLPDS